MISIFGNDGYCIKCRYFDFQFLKECASNTDEMGGQETDNALDLIEEPGKDNTMCLKKGQGACYTPDPKEEQCTDNAPDFKGERSPDNTHALKEKQEKHNSSGSDTNKTQSAGNNCGRKHKRRTNTLVHDKPPTKRSRGSVTTDNGNIREETTPTTVTRSRRTRKPTFSSSEWATPHTSPHRHRRVKEEGHMTGRGCPLRQWSESLEGDPGYTGDKGPAGEPCLPPGQFKHESEDPSKTSILSEALQPAEAVIKQDIDADQDAPDSAVPEAEPTGATDGSKMTPRGDRIWTKPKKFNPFEDDTIIPYNDTAGKGC